MLPFRGRRRATADQDDHGDLQDWRKDSFGRGLLRIDADVRG
jgi:hypothetical protein